MFCKIDSLYICVNDMERAIKFYEEFFEQGCASELLACCQMRCKPVYRISAISS